MQYTLSGLSTNLAIGSAKKNKTIIPIAPSVPATAMETLKTLWALEYSPFAILVETSLDMAAGSPADDSMSKKV